MLAMARSKNSKLYFQLIKTSLFLTKSQQRAIQFNETDPKLALITPYLQNLLYSQEAQPIHCY